MLKRTSRTAVAAVLLWAAAVAPAAPRVWVADQGDNQGNNNRILEIDPLNRKDPPDAEGDAIVLQTVPSPAVTFLDELTFDRDKRMWCLVKDAPSQDPDGAKLIDPFDDPATVLRTIRPTLPGEALGGILEGLAFDGQGLWLTAVRQNLSGNLLTRVSPVTGNRIAPFDTGALGTAGRVSIPGNIAQGLLYEPPSGGRTYGYLWHSDVQAMKIWKLDIGRLFDDDPANDHNLAVAEFDVPFGPKGMDWMGDKIWVASPHNGIFEFDPATGATVRLFSTPQWNLDGVAILDLQTPLMRLSTELLTPQVWIGGNAAPDSFTIRNVGPGTMTYSLAVSAPWLQVAPAAGSCEAEPDTIGVTYQTVGMRAGTYMATITISSPEAINSPQTVAVELTVQTVGPDLDGDADVDQEDFGLLQACFTGEGNAPPAGCSRADFDGDNDVDVTDFLTFSACFTRPGEPATPGCD
ncbi:MAG TPA: hypothetical protein PL151_20440 [Phycisphaerae bacterium]|nr:hypothetical protein [Phycisphaerae bacterium]HOJ74748.1 hypothetical protein [Phycisphaerae bacterium]HOM52117.1 hypothetical protein [Phycisphaerae bacterium]HPP27644.1 hypothetical protein [Phycisphaerae bacterium]HPZ97618.1 hypothetical protein [Phycisphaerae bacterium]